jgi:DNA-binding transcriptional ArsR family regulator
MVELSASDLSLTFGALSDPSRRAILQALERGEQRVTEIAEPFAVSLNAISKHVKVLERAGLVQRRIQGRQHWLRLRPQPLRQAAHWLEHYRAFWDNRLEALEAFLVREQRSGKSTAHGPRPGRSIR